MMCSVGVNVPGYSHVDCQQKPRDLWEIFTTIFYRSFDTFRMFLNQNICISTFYNNIVLGTGLQDRSLSAKATLQTEISSYLCNHYAL